MATKAKRHIHKYHQVNLSGTKVWACARPDCNHYMPNHMKNMVPGKASICWKCESDMILDGDAITMDRPICIECRGGIILDSDIDNLSDAMRARLTNQSN